MAFSGGVFSRLFSWTVDAANGVKIRADRMDQEMTGFATGLSTCITKDGQTTITANLPMGGFRHTGVGNGVARNDYASLGQAQDQAGTFVAAANVGGTADAITLTPAPAITAYAAGQRFSFVAEATNTAAVTVATSGLTARAVTKYGATALVAGDITTGDIVTIHDDGTRYQLLSSVRTPVLTAGAIGVAPVGGVIDYAGSTAPSGWLLAYGQAVSRTTYSALFTAISTTYGVGDGSTTFNLPDLRGRVLAGKDDMGGVSADRLLGTGGSAGPNGDVLGAAGGEETETLVVANLPSAVLNVRTSLTAQSGSSAREVNAAGGTDIAAAELGGSDSPFNIMQPTIILNKIIYTGVAS